MASSHKRQKVSRTILIILLLVVLMIITIWKKDCYFNCFTFVSDPESDFDHMLDQGGGEKLRSSEVIVGGIEHIMSEVGGGGGGEHLISEVGGGGGGEHRLEEEEESILSWK